MYALRVMYAFQWRSRHTCCSDRPSVETSVPRRSDVLLSWCHCGRLLGTCKRHSDVTRTEVECPVDAYDLYCDHQHSRTASCQRVAVVCTTRRSVTCLSMGTPSGRTDASWAIQAQLQVFLFAASAFCWRNAWCLSANNFVSLSKVVNIQLKFELLIHWFIKIVCSDAKCGTILRVTKNPFFITTFLTAVVIGSDSIRCTVTT